jgi:hypothetical protein
MELEVPNDMYPLDTYHPCWYTKSEGQLNYGTESGLPFIDGFVYFTSTLYFVLSIILELRD